MRRICSRPTPSPRTSIGATTTSTSGFTGFLPKKQPASAVSPDSGAHSSSSGDGFSGFGGKSAPDPFEAQAAAASRPAQAAPEKPPAAAPAAAPSSAADSSFGFGAGGGRATFAGLSASPPRPAGIVGFDDFGGKSAPDPFEEDGETAAASRPAEKPAPGSFGSGGHGVGRMLRAAMTDSVRTRNDSISSPKATVAPTTTTTGFTGFGAGKKSADTGFGAAGTTAAAPAATTVAAPTGFTGFGAGAPVAPAASTVSTSTGFTGFGAGKKAETGFTGFGAGAPVVKSTFTGFNTNKAAAAPPTSGFSGFGAKAATAPTTSTSGFTGFGAKRNGEMAAPAPAKPASSFTGFGTMKATTTAAAPTSTGTGFTGFGTMKSSSTAAGTGTTPAPSGFTGFGTAGAPPAKPTVPVAATTGFTGFGTVQKTAEAQPTTPAPSGFTGFGTTTASKVAGTGTKPSGFTGFLTNTGTAPAVDRVQMDFGTLHVSGPPHLMNAIAENRRRMGDEKEIKVIY